MVDVICEPFMERISIESIMAAMFGLGKNSEAGMMICLVFGEILKKCKYQELV